VISSAAQRFMAGRMGAHPCEVAAYRLVGVHPGTVAAFIVAAAAAATLGLTLAHGHTTLALAA
jgi:hypothetical protein